MIFLIAFIPFVSALFGLFEEPRFLIVESDLNINDLNDILISNPTNNQILVYQSATGLWINANQQAGGGSRTYTGILPISVDNDNNKISLNVQPASDWNGTFDGNNSQYYTDFNNHTNRLFSFLILDDNSSFDSRYNLTNDTNNPSRINFLTIANHPADSDTNIFSSGVADCNATSFVFGFNADGTTDCRTDQTGGGGSESFYTAGGNILIDSTDNNAIHFDEGNWTGNTHLYSADQNFLDNVKNNFGTTTNGAMYSNGNRFRLQLTGASTPFYSFSTQSLLGDIIPVMTFETGGAQTGVGLIESTLILQDTNGVYNGTLIIPHKDSPEIFDYLEIFYNSDTNKGTIQTVANTGILPNIIITPAGNLELSPDENILITRPSEPDVNGTVDFGHGRLNFGEAFFNSFISTKDVNSPRICLAGDCRTSWPTGSESFYTAGGNIDIDSADNNAIHVKDANLFNTNRTIDANYSFSDQRSIIFGDDNDGRIFSDGNRLRIQPTSDATKYIEFTTYDMSSDVVPVIQFQTATTNYGLISPLLYVQDINHIANGFILIPHKDYPSSINYGSIGYDSAEEEFLISAVSAIGDSTIRLSPSGTGTTMINLSSELTFRDTDLFINSPTDGEIDLNADLKITLNSPNVEVSHDLNIVDGNIFITPENAICWTNDCSVFEFYDLDTNKLKIRFQ